jgi:hypothetical protein
MLDKSVLLFGISLSAFKPPFGDVDTSVFTVVFDFVQEALLKSSL